MKRRGQFSTEYMFLIAVVAFMLIIGTVIFIIYSPTVEEGITRENAEHSLKQIVRVADQIHTYGEGTRNSVIIAIPSKVERITFSGNEAFMRMKTGEEEYSDIVVESKVPFITRTYLNPPSGKFDFLVGSKRVGGELQICVAGFDAENLNSLDCEEGDDEIELSTIL
jgi:hypothetical protein